MEMKKSYQSPTVTVKVLETSGAILTGSVTSCAIKVQNVTVEEYSAGFNEAGNDFKDISF